MWSSNSMQFGLLSSPLFTGSAPKIDLDWYAPNSTQVNNLSAVVDGHDVFGFLFNSSMTPLDVPYDTYNWCNMPHVRAQEYVQPSAEYKLKYVEVIHRHHKRTPYASNTFPHEADPWSCDDEALFYYGAPEPEKDAAAINWKVYKTTSNPFDTTGFAGTCQFPQITAGGLLDSRQHGRDLFGVYHDLLHFLPDKLDQNKISYRVTNNVITSQVAGQVIYGMYPDSNRVATPVLIQSSSIDSLEPKYSCPAAASMYASYGVGSSNPSWTAHLDRSQVLFAKLDSVSGISSADVEWHQWFDHYFDNLAERLCHDKPLPCHPDDSSLCITQADADAIFRRGEYEYSFIYRDSPQSLSASVASYGIWVAELASNLRNAMDGADTFLYRHNIAHDGSLSRLLSILQVDVMIWPGMGSEVVFELYENNKAWFLRVLWRGRVLRSSHPSLGLMDMVDLNTFLDYVDGLVGKGASKIPDMCKIT